MKNKIKSVKGGQGIETFDKQAQKEIARPLSRVDRWKNVTAAVSLAALSLVACKNESSQSNSYSSHPTQQDRVDQAGNVNQNPVVTPNLNSNQDSLDNELYFLDSIPDAEIVNRSASISVPEGLNMSENDFVNLSKRYMELVVEPELILLEQAIASAHPSQHEAVYLQFINKVLNGVTKINEFIPYFQERSSTVDMEQWVRILKPFFNAGGYYFEFGKVARQMPNGTLMQFLILDIYPIIESRVAKIADEYVNIYELRYPLYTNDSDKPVALSDFDNDTSAILFRSEFKPEQKFPLLVNSGVISEMPSQEIIDQAVEKYLDDTELHEAIHCYLARKFSVASNSDLRMAYNINYSVENIDGEGRAIDLSGVYSPVQIQELAAVGLEIARSESQFPLSGVMYFSEMNNVGYALATSTLIAMTLKNHDETSLKADLLNRFLNGYQVSDAEMARFFLELTPVQRKRVGYEMYMMAYNLFEKAERGELVVNMRQ